MIAVLIATATTAFVALVLAVVMVVFQGRRAPRSTTAPRHLIGGVGAASAALLLASAGLFLAFAASSAEAVVPRSPVAIQPHAPVQAPVQLETLDLPPD